ncbi:MAG: tRNA (adenosine(37)-N6)-dimethylallyltransferase MiaA [Pseudomonadota bacterium]
MSEDRDHLPLAIFLMGPTASGKTDLAIKLVSHFPCDIISVDSVMVYRGLDIGSAKPEPDTLVRAPHRLLDICDPTESYSAARFREDALREMSDIAATGRIPLLTGGTGLYFRALQQGLSELPSASEEVRKKLDADAERLGWAAMHERLEQIDPPTAARIHPNDPQRIQRALEVYAMSGKPMSELIATQSKPELPYRIIKLVLAPDSRDLLRERIAQRFLLMLEQGLVREVDSLYQRGDLNLSLPAIRAVGYRQVWQYLAGQWDYDTMLERAITATRQLAKRQLTWLRAEGDAIWFDSLASDVEDQVFSYLQFSDSK